MLNLSTLKSELYITPLITMYEVGLSYTLTVHVENTW